MTSRRAVCSPRSGLSCYHWPTHPEETAFLPFSPMPPAPAGPSFWRIRPTPALPMFSIVPEVSLHRLFSATPAISSPWFATGRYAEVVRSLHPDELSAVLDTALPEIEEIQPLKPADIVTTTAVPVVPVRLASAASTTRVLFAPRIFPGFSHTSVMKSPLKDVSRMSCSPPLAML